MAAGLRNNHTPVFFRSLYVTSAYNDTEACRRVIEDSSNTAVLHETMGMWINWRLRY
jgi:hypothetical protein